MSSPALGIRVGLTPYTCFESIIHASNNRRRKKVLSPFGYISVKKKSIITIISYYHDKAGFKNVTAKMMYTKLFIFHKLDVLKTFLGKILQEIKSEYA